MRFDVNVARRSPIDALVEAGPRSPIDGGPPPETGDGLAFSVVRLEVVATTSEGHGDALRELIEVAKKSCLVARSLACPVELTATVRTDGRSGGEGRAAV